MHYLSLRPLFGASRSLSCMVSRGHDRAPLCTVKMLSILRRDALRPTCLDNARLGQHDGFLEDTLIC